MKTIFLFPLLLIGIATARPQEGAVNEDFETLTDGVEQLGKNFWKIQCHIPSYITLGKSEKLFKIKLSKI